MRQAAPSKSRFPLSLPRVSPACCLSWSQSGYAASSQNNAASAICSCSRSRERFSRFNSMDVLESGRLAGNGRIGQTRVRRPGDFPAGGGDPMDRAPPGMALRWRCLIWATLTNASTKFPPAKLPGLCFDFPRRSGASMRCRKTAADQCLSTRVLEGAETASESATLCCVSEARWRAAFAG